MFIEKYVSNSSYSSTNHIFVTRFPRFSLDSSFHSSSSLATRDPFVSSFSFHRGPFFKTSGCQSKNPAIVENGHERAIGFGIRHMPLNTVYEMTWRGWRLPEYPPYVTENGGACITREVIIMRSTPCFDEKWGLTTSRIDDGGTNDKSWIKFNLINYRNNDSIRRSASASCILY